MCSICKQKDTSLLYRKDDYGIAQCHSCTVRFRVPQPSHEELRQIYRDYYHPWKVEKEVEEVAKKIKRETFERRIQEIQQYVRRGKILDVGCAAGYFLENAQSKGFEPYGIELSETFFKETHHKFGDGIYWGSIEDSPFKNNFVFSLRQIRHWDFLYLAKIIPYF